MESAVAEHLRCPRTRHRRIEDDYAPLYPASSARAPITVGQVMYHEVSVLKPDE